MKTDKLRELERRAAALNAGLHLVTVIFTNGVRRTMRLEDVLLLLLDDEANGAERHVKDVIGEPMPGDGKLLELVQGVVREEQ